MTYSLPYIRKCLKFVYGMYMCRMCITNLQPDITCWQKIFALFSFFFLCCLFVCSFSFNQFSLIYFISKLFSTPQNKVFTIITSICLFVCLFLFILILPTSYWHSKFFSKSQNKVFIITSVRLFVYDPLTNFFLLILQNLNPNHRTRT